MLSLCNMGYEDFWRKKYTYSILSVKHNLTTTRDYILILNIFVFLNTFSYNTKKETRYLN